MTVDRAYRQNITVADENVPSSSTTVVISSYPGSFMAKSSVNHLIHDYTDVFILSRLSRACSDCEQRSDGGTHGPM